MLSRAVRYLLGPLLKLACFRHVALSLTERFLRNRQADEDNIDDIIDTAYSFRGVPPYRAIEPSQVRSELKELTERVLAIQPKRVVEIGTHNGGTFYVWARAFHNVEHIISIDLPGGKFGGGYQEWEKELFRTFSREVRMSFLRMDSHSDRCEDKLETLCNGEQVDFLFIDGDHTYHGVREDFDRYHKFVSDGGIIALHDIVEHPPETGCEVHRFWRKLRTGSYSTGAYDTEEIVENWGQEWAGIGIVYV